MKKLSLIGKLSLIFWCGLHAYLCIEYLISYIINGGFNPKDIVMFAVGPLVLLEHLLDPVFRE